MEIPDNCWSKTIPFIPVFPTLIRNSCARGAAVDPVPKGIEHVQDRKPSISGLLPLQPVNRAMRQCWSSLTNVPDSFAAGSSTARIGQTMAAKHSSPGQSTLPFLGLSSAGQPGQDIAWCWSSLSSIEGCVYDIYGSLSRGQFRGIGTAYCRAITDVNDICWPQMFPLAIYSFISSLAHSITLKRLVRHYIIRLLFESPRMRIFCNFLVSASCMVVRATVASPMFGFFWEGKLYVQTPQFLFQTYKLLLQCSHDFKLSHQNPSKNVI
ncbi:uncharacterized protein LOC122302967 isoform X3 [Carya illinoinensis]|uniref:uncharacterized protein LOC122302967 isoform X3 n=1 Tax=Carya illinoinensis TaxID=32201 RepID=UPI001C71F540|nr:uncharacterized protein LOC122302967 isoform X3 [Carya illinoinensis]